MQHYLGVCAIAKDETPYLEEWVRFYLLQGVDHILLFDNESKEPIRHTLREWIAAGYVRVIDVPGKSRQLPCYQLALDTFGKDFFWLAFLDLDEFIVTRKAFSLAEFLLPYEPFGGVGLHWALFGTSGIDAFTADLVTEKFIMRLADDRSVHMHIKSVVQPEKVLSVGDNPHCFVYKNGHSCVDENRIPIPSGYPLSPFTNALAQVNHYYTKSRQEYFAKTQKGNADSEKQRTVHEPFAGDIVDRSASTYSRILKRTMQENAADMLRRYKPMRNREISQKELILDIAACFSHKKFTRIFPLLAKLSLCTPAEIVTPLKITYLIECKKYDDAMVLAHEFFKRMYTVEVGTAYVRLLRLKGLEDEAQRFARLLDNLKSRYNIDQCGVP
jgi:hypothetical protein